MRNMQINVKCDILVCIQKCVGSVYNTILAYNQLKALEVSQQEGLGESILSHHKFLWCGWILQRWLRSCSRNVRKIRRLTSTSGTRRRGTASTLLPSRTIFHSVNTWWKSITLQLTRSWSTRSACVTQSSTWAIRIELLYWTIDKMEHLCF